MTIISKQHIKIATRIAGYGDVIKGRMSALALTKSGKIITCASNHRLYGDYINWSEHCEAAVLRKLNKLKAFKRHCNITIFVFRISSFGISLAKPCKKCQKLLSKYDVKVLYTTDKGGIESL